jgi:hypothetical protein
MQPKATASASGNMAWGNLSAASLNHETFLDLLAEGASDVLRQGATDADDQPTHSTEKPPTAASRPWTTRATRSWRPIDLYRHKLLSEATARGEKMNWCTTEAWQEVRSKFARLSEGEKSFFEAECQQVKVIANSNRMADASSPASAIKDAPAEACPSGEMAVAQVAAVTDGTRSVAFQMVPVEHPSPKSETLLSIGSGGAPAPLRQTQDLHFLFGDHQNV